MQLTKGQIVTSRAGRDVTRSYVVTGTTDERVLLANGGKFTLSAPKAKNVRHINPTGKVLSAGEMQDDTTIRTALAAYDESIRGPKREGG